MVRYGLFGLFLYLFINRADQYATMNVKLISSCLTAIVMILLNWGRSSHPGAYVEQKYEMAFPIYLQLWSIRKSWQAWRQACVLAKIKNTKSVQDYKRQLLLFDCEAVRTCLPNIASSSTHPVQVFQTTLRLTRHSKMGLLCNCNGLPTISGATSRSIRTITPTGSTFSLVSFVQSGW